MNVLWIIAKYKFSATQIHRIVQWDGWALLIIFTVKRNSSSNILVLKGEGILKAHLVYHELTISWNYDFFFKHLSYFVDGQIKDGMNS